MAVTWDSGGGGANGFWEPLGDRLAHPMGKHPSGGVRVPICIPIGFKCSTRYYESFWLNKPLDWEIPTFEEACIAFQDAISNPDLWEIWGELIYTRDPTNLFSRWVGVSCPEELIQERIDDPQWLTMYDCQAIHTWEEKEIGGYPRIKWRVWVDDYLYFIRMFPPPPGIIPPPLVPIIGMGEGDSGGLISTLLFFGGESIWRKKSSS